MKKVKDEKLKEDSLKLSVKEASAASVMSGSGDAYIIPFALALNASNFQIGFLSSFAGLFNTLSQVLGSRLSYLFDRKKIVVSSVFFQVIAWVSIFVLSILVWRGYIVNNVAMILIIVYVCSIFFGSLGGPAWFSWMGDLVPIEKRGVYFSKRNRIAGFVAMVVTLLISFFLDYTRAIGLTLLGFSVVAGIAVLGRGFSWYFLSRQYEPKTKVERDSYFSFIQFVKKAPSNNYGRFVIYVGLIMAASNFAGPFISVYMLNELNYSYFWFTMVNLSATVFALICMPFWGTVGDVYGNKKLLKIGGILLIFIPLPWIFLRDPVQLIFTSQLLAGFGWTAFNLGASNFIYDAVTPQRRAICVAYFTMFSGIGVFIGASLGGFFAENFHPGFSNVFVVMFVISILLRGVASLVFLPMIKEVKSNVKVGGTFTMINDALLVKPRYFFNMLQQIKSPTNFLIGRRKVGKR